MTSKDWCEHEIRHIVGALPCGILSVPLLLLIGRGLGRTLGPAPGPLGQAGAGRLGALG